jgi:hypothetical protein
VPYLQGFRYLKARDFSASGGREAAPRSHMLQSVSSCVGVATPGRGSPRPCVTTRRSANGREQCRLLDDFDGWAPWSSARISGWASAPVGLQRRTYSSTFRVSARCGSVVGERRRSQRSPLHIGQRSGARSPAADATAAADTANRVNTASSTAIRQGTRWQWRADELVARQRRDSGC